MAKFASKFRIDFKGDDLGVFDTEKVTMSEAMQLEDQTGLTIIETIQGVTRYSARAIQALVWLHQLHNGKPSNWTQDFQFGDFEIHPIEDEPDPTEAAEAADVVEDVTGTPSKSAAGGSSPSSATTSV